MFRRAPQLRDYSDEQCARLIRDGRAYLDGDTIYPFVSGAAASEIQAVKGSGGSGVDLAITGQAFAAGSLVILGIYHRTTATATANSASDTKGNAWQVDDAISNASHGIAICSAYLTSAITSSDTITVAWGTPANTGTKAWKISEMTGMATSSWLDQHNHSTSNSATPAIASITPASGDKLVFVISGDESSNTVSSILSGWTQSGTRQSSSGPTTLAAAYRELTFDGTTLEDDDPITYGGNLTNGRNAIASYKVAGAGGSTYTKAGKGLIGP